MEIYIVKYFFADGDHLVLGVYTDREDARNCVKHYVMVDEETIVKTVEGTFFDWYELDDDTYYEISSMALNETIYDENGDEVGKDEDEDEDDFFCQGECTTCPNVEECYGAEDDPEQDDDEDEEEEKYDNPCFNCGNDCDACTHAHIDGEDDFRTYLRNLFASILE